MLTHESRLGRTDPAGMSAPANATSKLNAERPKVVADQYDEELTRTFLENMNLLYVAFTRPTDRLYVIAKAKPTSFGKGQVRKT